MVSADEQKSAWLQRYNEKISQRLRTARAKNVDEARRKANEERGCVSPLGGTAIDKVKR
jgi:hypothetical protein